MERQKETKSTDKEHKDPPNAERAARAECSQSLFADDSGTITTSSTSPQSQPAISRGIATSIPVPKDKSSIIFEPANTTNEAARNCSDQQQDQSFQAMPWSAAESPRNLDYPEKMRSSSTVGVTGGNNGEEERESKRRRSGEDDVAQRPMMGRTSSDLGLSLSASTRPTTTLHTARTGTNNTTVAGSTDFLHNLHQDVGSIYSQFANSAAIGSTCPRTGDATLIRTNPSLRSQSSLLPFPFRLVALTVPQEGGHPLSTSSQQLLTSRALAGGVHVPQGGLYSLPSSQQIQVSRALHGVAVAPWSTLLHGATNSSLDLIKSVQNPSRAVQGLSEGGHSLASPQLLTLGTALQQGVTTGPWSALPQGELNRRLDLASTENQNDQLTSLLSLSSSSNNGSEVRNQPILTSRAHRIGDSQSTSDAEQGNLLGQPQYETIASRFLQENDFVFGNHSTSSLRASAAGVPPLHALSINQRFQQELDDAASAHLQSIPLASSVAAVPARPQGTTASPSPSTEPNVARAPPGADFFQSSPGILMHLPADEKHLSDFQVLVRKQIEYFEATKEDITSNVQGRKKKLYLGQVGLRCKHCYFEPRRRGKAAVYFPMKLIHIYQAAQNMAALHLCESCLCIDPNLKAQLKQLRDFKYAGSGGKQYWADGGKVVGLYDAEDGIRFYRRRRR